MWKGCPEKQGSAMSPPTALEKPTTSVSLNLSNLKTGNSKYTI